MEKVPVTVIIPILNEAENLSRCLGALSWADEIFVVDSCSVDNSVAIAESLGAKVVQFKFGGIWPKKKNWALENLPLSHEWVLMLDADEVLPFEAEKEIREICAKNARGFDGYYINRRFMFMGKWLKHAYYPNWTLRLFKHRLGRFEKLTNMPTESGDAEVHEHVRLKGKVGYLECEMAHFAFPTVGVFVEKHNRYSNWEARVEVDRALLGKTFEESVFSPIGINRWLRDWTRHLPFRSFLRFFYVYIIQRGFLDGREGYYFARLHSFYEFLSVCKAYELRKNLAQSDMLTSSQAQ